MTANAQYTLGASVVSSGATEASGGDYALRGTVGQPVVGLTADATHHLWQGFWYARGALLPPPLIFANLRVLLEGPYAGSGQMTKLLNPSYVPLSQPYGDAHFDDTPVHYEGVEGTGSLHTDAVDWVVVEVRTGIAATDSVTSRAGFVMTDGSIRDTDGTSLLGFPGLTAGDYRLVVRHRNHIPVMTATAVTLGVSPTLYNFTDAMSKAYMPGSGNPMVALGDGLFGMFASDYNCDGQVTAPDFNAYISATTAGATGYVHSDFNMDGQVTAPDFNRYYANTTSGAANQVPEN